MSAAAINTRWNDMNATVLGTFKEIKTGSLLRLENVFVEDLGKCGVEAVERLSIALYRGTPFVKDRKRKRFYEVQLDGESFYIHVLRGAAKVLLLARWPR